jgi:hypothetical protein
VRRRVLGAEPEVVDLVPGGAWEAELVAEHAGDGAEPVAVVEAAVPAGAVEVVAVEEYWWRSAVRKTWLGSGSGT